MGKTNLDQLHHVVENRPQTRGCGKTFSRCHELAAAVEFEQEFIVCEITTHNDMRYLKNMIMEVFDDHELSLTWLGRMEARSNRSRILFMTSRDVEERTRGIGEFGHILMRHWD